MPTIIITDCSIHTAAADDANGCLYLPLAGLKMMRSFRMSSGFLSYVKGCVGFCLF